MQFRERAQVDYTDGAVVDMDPDSGGRRVLRTRATVQRKGTIVSSVQSDEIERSDSEESDGSEKLEAISDDSSKLDDEIPVAVKVYTGPLRPKKAKSKRKAVDDDGGKTRTKKAAPKDLLLKYLQPNVSNVVDRPRHDNAGSDSDDVIDGAPPLLQAGRRKRKVVAHPRGNSVPVSSDDNGDEDDDNVRPFKKGPSRTRNGFSIVRASSRPTRQSKVSYKDASSSDDEQDEPRCVVSAGRGQPETQAENMRDDEYGDDDDKDFTDFDVFAFTQSKNGSKRAVVKEDAPPSVIKCYTRLKKVQTKTEVIAVPRAGQRIQRLSKAGKSKDEGSGSDGLEASEETLPGQRRSLREKNVKSLKDASSSDEDGEDDGPPVGKESDGVSVRSIHHLDDDDREECEASHSREAEDISKLAVPMAKEHEIPRTLTVGVFSIEREDGNDPTPITKRIGRVEKILSMRKKSGDVPAIFCIKEFGKSYRDVVNVHESTLVKHCPQLIRNFWKRLSQLGREEGHCLDRSDSPAFDPLFTRIDRIIAHENVKKSRHFLVKWCRLPYTEATWEKEENLTRDRSAITRYYQINRKASHSVSFGRSIQKLFRDGRALRDYQEAGVTWLDHNFENRTNCVLADEMGLGKTIQSVAMLETLRCKRNLRGPFLVIAPVSTLGHWQREIESLTDMNCVVYSGTQEDRDIIRQYEFHYADNSKTLKFNVLLTSFEMVMRDQNKLARESWQYIVVDEAHRLKSKDSKTTQSLRQLKVRKGGLLLLTGTPVQNNTKEIFSLLNLLDPETFNSENDFLEKFGEIKEAEQIKDLQENVLRPRLLRRMKEDVEKSIPQKEETIVWVELTKDQRAFYKAIFENNVASLLKGSSSGNLPNLRNVAMELRKVCNHPFLCDGLEDSLLSKYGLKHGQSHVPADILQNSSGKMVLVDKLLPKLKDAGRRVLIFSQFTIMLDLLEDYMAVKGYSYERIDGKIRGSERQAAIDRYSAKDSDIFVFLLSTRAGGLGITLTAADTCIIYDSDWNPQNDLQAMARCHRIGQTKDVKIYRLITRNTYEERLFECSSRKYGLDEAILGNRVGAEVNLDHDKNIESLLKHGAYDIMKDENEEASAAFTAQDIDQILEQRTQQRQIGGRGNNTFSVATFRTNPDAELAHEDSKQDSKEFWQELMPEACDRTLAEALVAQAPTDLQPRKRTRGRVNYSENAKFPEESSSDLEDPRKSKKGGGEQDAAFSSDLDDSEESANQINYWSEKELKRLEDRLFALGRGRTEQIRDEARLGHRSPEDIDEVSNALIELCQRHVDAQVALTPVENCEANPVEPTENEKQLTLKSVVFPASVEKVFESASCKERIQRNAQRYLQQLHERKILAEAIQVRSFDFIDMPSRNKKLPSWWGPKEDADLLRGAHIHGHKDFRKIRSDKNLSFANRCDLSLGHEVCDNGNQIEESMPTDQVLGSRLRNLIEALPNGMTTFVMRRRVARNESSRRSRAKGEQGKSDDTKKPQPVTNDKNLAEWVTSSSLISTLNAEIIGDRPISEKAKLKGDARQPQKPSAARIGSPESLEWSTIMRPPNSFQVVASTVDNNQSTIKPNDFRMSPRKPLSQNFHRESEILELNANEKRPKVPQENKEPKKRKLSLSKSPIVSAGKQTTLKSFMRAVPTKV